jgi:DNA-binding GntR family transcriptional regulator
MNARRSLARPLLGKFVKAGNAKRSKTRGRPKGSGSQRVYDAIRDQILTLRLKPGIIIDELALVKVFNLSRTPVREALIRLEADGLVQIVPNRGARVAALDFENIGKLFEALDLYARAICVLAAKRRDPESISAARTASDDFSRAAKQRNFKEMGEANWRFHFELGRASGNSYIGDAQTRIMNETMRLAYLVHLESVKRDENYQGYFNQISDEHEELLQHIENGSAYDAERLAGQHVRLFRDNIVRYVSQNDLSDVGVGGAN